MTRNKSRKVRDGPLIEEIDEVETVPFHGKNQSSTTREAKNSKPKKMEPLIDDDESEEVKNIKRELLKKAFSTYRESEATKKEENARITLTTFFKILSLFFLISFFSLFVFQRLVAKIPPEDVVTTADIQHMITGNHTIKTFNILLGLSYAPRTTLLYLAVTERELLDQIFLKTGVNYDKESWNYVDTAFKVMAFVFSPRSLIVVQSANLLVDRHYDLVKNDKIIDTVKDVFSNWRGLANDLSESFWKVDQTFETLFFCFTIMSQLLFMLFDVASRISFFKRSIKFMIMLALWIVLNSFFIPPTVLTYMFKITYFVQPFLTIVMFISEGLEMKYEQKLMDAQEQEKREAFIKEAREALLKAQSKNKQ